MTPEEIEQMKRDEELRRLNEERKARAWERNRKAKQVAVSVRVLGGGFWTDVDGSEDVVATPARVAGTSMGGLSVLVTKGMHHNFAVGAELAGGRSGQANFSNTSWQWMEGDVARQASFGRVQGIGVVRFGDPYVVAMRLGVGVQGASYDSSFTTGGTTMDGPGSPFEVDVVWSFGGTFDTRLGKSWVLGVGAAATAGIKTDTLGLDAGFHIGYRWHP